MRADAGFLRGLARAHAGALIFALPMLMTMEMWEIGFYVEEWKLILLLAALIPLLVALSHHAGFVRTVGLLEDVVDAFVAIAVAATMAAVVLFLFGVVDATMPLREIVGKIALQTLPASFGAVLAGEQLSARDQTNARRSDESPPGYAGTLLLMAAGALYLGLNVAPTEEIVLLSNLMAPVHTLVLALLSLALMHAFVYAVEFHGSRRLQSDAGFGALFLRYTVTGYAIVLLIGAYLLWTFGRTGDTSLDGLLASCVVLGFPGAVGAAAARLIL